MKNEKSAKKRTQSGQGLVEYALLLGMVAGMGTLLFKMMPSMLAKLETAVKKDLKYAYKLGDPKACGVMDNEDGCSGAKRHPRVLMGSDNFRLFGRGDK